MAARRVDITGGPGKNGPWDTTGCTLIEGNCHQILREVREGSVDLVFADPPYRLSGSGTTCHGGARAPVTKGSWDAPLGVSEALEDDLDWLAGCRRVLKSTGSLWVSGTFHNIFSVGHALEILGFGVVNLVTWRKPNPAPNLGCRSFVHSTELVIWATKAPGHTFHYELMRQEHGGTQMGDVWTMSAHDRGGDQRIHPAQKPIELLDRIVRCSSNPGDLVLDPFAGSGTTGVVSLNRGRRFLGIESDHAHFEAGAGRLKSVVSWKEEGILADFLEEIT